MVMHPICTTMPGKDVDDIVNDFRLLGRDFSKAAETHGGKTVMGKTLLTLRYQYINNLMKKLTIGTRVNFKSARKRALSDQTGEKV